MGIFELKLCLNIDQQKCFRLAAIDPKEMIPLIQLQTDYIGDISKASGYGHSMDCMDIW